MLYNEVVSLSKFLINCHKKRVQDHLRLRPFANHHSQMVLIDISIFKSFFINFFKKRNSANSSKNSKNEAL